MADAAARAARARAGSRRKRDRDALAAESAKPLPADVQFSPRSVAVWGAVLDDFRATSPEADRVAALWLDPVTVAGERGDVLCLACPPSVRSWIERRVGDRLTVAVLDHGFEGLEVYDV